MPSSNKFKMPQIQGDPSAFDKLIIEHLCKQIIGPQHEIDWNCYDDFNKTDSENKTGEEQEVTTY